MLRTDNAVKNRWAALCKKDPQLERDHVLSMATTSATKGTRSAFVPVATPSIHRLQPSQEG